MDHFYIIERNLVSLVSERLTNSEIESLQQDKRESIAWARKEFAKEPKTTAD